jgi:hypothetical protein
VSLPGDQTPAAAPPSVSNTRAAVAAYAEAVTDGVAAELRRRLFRAIWAGGRHLSGAYEVRRLITAVMWPDEDINARLASPDFPSMLLRDPDLTRITRRSGGTIAPDGGPLTHAGVPADPAVAARLACAARPDHPGGHRVRRGPAIRR